LAESASSRSRLRNYNILLRRARQQALFKDYCHRLLASGFNCGRSLQAACCVAPFEPKQLAVAPRSVASRAG